MPQSEKQDKEQVEGDANIIDKRRWEPGKSDGSTSILSGEEDDVDENTCRVKFATREDLWEEEMEELPNAEIVLDPLITVDVTIGGEVMKAVIDTGATYSCISQELYENLREMRMIKGELPMCKVQLITAVGRKRIKVDKQVYIEIILNAIGSNVMMFVVPGLFTPILMGLNWLREARIMIDCGNGIVSYREDKHEGKTEKRMNGKVMEIGIEEKEKHYVKCSGREKGSFGWDVHWEEAGCRCMMEKP